MFLRGGTAGFLVMKQLQQLGQDIQILGFWFKFIDPLLSVVLNSYHNWYECCNGFLFFVNKPIGSLSGTAAVTECSTSRHPNLHPAHQQTATYQQPANRQLNGLLWKAISESSRPAFSDDHPTSVLPFLGFGNLSPWRSPLKMWSRSLCRSQSPGSPTPGSPFIFLFIPSHHPAPNCHLCVIVSSPTCRSQWKGWRWAPEWWRAPLKAGWATNRPERMSATWTFNCFHESLQLSLEEWPWWCLKLWGFWWWRWWWWWW